MIIDKDNINELPIKEQKRILALLKDLEDINSMSKVMLYIDLQDLHNEWSPERVDPCPDYYGCYRLKSKDGETFGLEMDIEDLDNCMCVLYDYLMYE